MFPAEDWQHGWAKLEYLVGAASLLRWIYFTRCVKSRKATNIRSDFMNQFFLFSIFVKVRGNMKPSLRTWELWERRVNRRDTTNTRDAVAKVPERCSSCSGTSILPLKVVDHLSPKSHEKKNPVVVLSTVTVWGHCVGLQLHCSPLWRTLF